MDSEWPYWNFYIGHFQTLHCLHLLMRYKPVKGKLWGTTAKGYEVGKYLYDSYLAEIPVIQIGDIVTYLPAR